MPCEYKDPRCAAEDFCYCGGEPDNAPGLLMPPHGTRLSRQDFLNMTRVPQNARAHFVIQDNTFGTTTEVESQSVSDELDDLFEEGDDDESEWDSPNSDYIDVET